MYVAFANNETELIGRGRVLMCMRAGAWGVIAAVYKYEWCTQCTMSQRWWKVVKCVAAIACCGLDLWLC